MKLKSRFTNTSYLVLFTNTSYLVLFTILIAISVTSVYAITITLGGDPIEILGVLNMNSNKITSLAEPTVSTDAATKNYVDNNNFQYIKTVERVGSFVLLSGDNELTASVSCSSGEVATGGGWVENVFDDDPVVFDSRAIVTSGVATGWEVFFGSLNGGSESLAAVVICATLQNTDPLP